MSDQNVTSKTARSTASPAGLTGIALLLLFVLFVSVNLLSQTSLRSWRLDLTEDRLYTLSDVTVRVLSEIEEPVTLRFYFSQALGREIPAYGILAGRIEDLLQEYETLSEGKVRVEIYDPEPFSDVEDRAVADGLQAVPIDATQANVFFGLVGTNTTDDLEAIPFFQPEREAFLEYDISRMVTSLAAPNRTVVGVLSTVPLAGSSRMNAFGQQEQVQPAILYEQIDDLFETRWLGASTGRIPDDVTLLMVVHPKDVDPRTLYAVDQYLLAGGKAMIFVDPFSEEIAAQGQQLGTDPDAGSDLRPIFEAWGVDYDKRIVAADRLTARKVAPGQGQRLVDYIAWLVLRGSNIDQETALTSGVDSLAVASSGALALTDDSPVTMTPLVSTSAGSQRLPVEKVQGFRRPLELLRQYEPGPTPLVVAARVTGPVPSAFPDGPPVAEGQDQPSPDQLAAHLVASTEPLDVILVADSDVLADRFWVATQNFFGRRVTVPQAGNGTFVLNAMEALSGTTTLLELRGRGTAQRPFDVIDGIRREADRAFESKERDLQKTLEETQAKLDQVRARGAADGSPGGGGAILSEEDRRSIETYQREILTTRAELRDVQRSLNAELDRLTVKLWFWNIAAVPLLVAVFAIGLALIRTYRRRHSAREAAAA